MAAVASNLDVSEKLLDVIFSSFVSAVLPGCCVCGVKDKGYYPKHRERGCSLSPVTSKTKQDESSEQTSEMSGSLPLQACKRCKLSGIPLENLVKPINFGSNSPGSGTNEFNLVSKL